MVYLVDVDGKFAAHIGAIIDIVVVAMPVNKKQDARVIVPRPGEASDSDIGVIAVIDNVEAADAGQHLGEMRKPYF